MITRLILLTLFIGGSLASFPQFIAKGKIEYERKTNQHALLDENNTWDEIARKSLPKFLTYYFDLTFDNDKTLYKPGREPDIRQNKHWGVYEGDNIIASNLDSFRSVTQKAIYGDVYLITDSIRKIEWKIGSEIRNIAGFDCRKAVGKIMDSIIVIAFYTDEILPGGGPESFAGLPGMILGIAIPKMHSTWYATKLQLVEPAPKDLASPRKGKKIAGNQFRQELHDILKNYGERVVKIQWQLML